MSDVAAASAAAAFTEFFQRGYGEWVGRLTGLLNGDRDAAEDIVQSMMIKLWEGWESVDPDREAPGIENPGGWLRVACGHEADKYRKRRYRTQPAVIEESAHPLLVAPVQDGASVAVANDGLLRMARLLSPEEFRLAVQLGAGHTIPSIAGGKSEARRLRAMRREMRRKLTPSANGPGETGEAHDAGEPADPNDLLARCRDLLPVLPRRQREIAEAALNGHSPSQIASQLGIEPNNARVNLSHSVGALARKSGVERQLIVLALADLRTAGRNAGPDHGQRLDQALAILEQVLRDSAGAVRAAESLLAAERGDEAAVVAWRVLGLAAKQSGQLPRAAGYLRRAIRAAEHRGLPYRAAEARMSLVPVLADRGNIEEALATAQLASAVLKTLDQARLQVNIGLVLSRTGRSREALAALDRAIPDLASAGEGHFEAVARNMRGVLHATVGRHQDAGADLTRAADLSAHNGYRQLNGAVQTNLGVLAKLTGNLPTALAHLDAAAEQFAAAGISGPALDVERADVLLTAGLVSEALTAAQSAIECAKRQGRNSDAPEAHLICARAALAGGDAETARRQVRIAAGMFARQRRTAWVELARSVELSARFADGERSRKLLAQAVAVADALAASGWQAAQYETRFLAARTALDLGMREEAERLLKQVSRRRSRGPADIRILGWQAHALHALSEGRIAAAERALTAGLRVHAEHSAILGATELRVYAAGQGHDLAALGVRLAIEHRDARALLRWAEAQRATSLRRRPVRPPDDAQTGDDLAALRRISAQMVEATTREKGLSGRRAGRAKLNAERLRLEAAVRDRTRYARGEYAPDPPFSAAALVAALGERVLVEFVRVDDVLYAVTVAGGAVRRHRLGSYSQVLKHLDSLRFSMSRLAWKFSSPTLWSAATATFDHSRQTLDALLFVELRAVVGTDASGDLVIVPTGSLHALPWGTLPTCASRAVTIAPSARLWMAAAEAAAEAETVGRQPDRTALIAGPGLDHAGPEIDALAPLYPHATVLTGPTATASAVAKALDGADLAHIATHGRFRADHPLFSSFDTYDGPLFAYDLERLAAAPRVLVLSACESALSGVRAGDELMGLASSMFTLGARTIISSIVPVDDDETRTVMLEFHRALADLPPAAALAKAMSRTGIEGWVCLGYGG